MAVFAGDEFEEYDLGLMRDSVRDSINGTMTVSALAKNRIVLVPIPVKSFRVRHTN